MSEDGLIKVPYIQRVKAIGGGHHLYFRKGGYREGPLRSPDGTQALKDEVDAILKRIHAVEAANSRPTAGTVGGMLDAYLKSSQFTSLAAITQYRYRNFARELKEDVGDVLLPHVTRAWIIELRDIWAPNGHNAANKRMQVLKNALAPAIDDPTDKRISGDPFFKVDKVKRPHHAVEANPSWEDSEVEAAIEDAIQRDTPGLARAVALGRYAGFRRGTICALPLGARVKALDEDGLPQRRIYWITNKKKVLADKKEDPRLTAILARTPDRALTVAYNADGNAWIERQLNQALQRNLDRLAKSGRVRSSINDKGEIYCPLTIHGLRHARGVELALAGASDSEIMAQLEHTTEAAAKIYRRQADRRRMADAAQDKIDNVVKLQTRRSKKTA